MDINNARNLLSKKTVNADELGMAYLLNNIEMHLFGTPLFTEEEISILVKKLPEAQYEYYNTYLSLYNWVVRYRTSAQSYSSQASHSLTKLIFCVRNTIASEKLIAQKGTAQIDDIIEDLSSFHGYRFSPLDREFFQSSIEILTGCLFEINCYNVAITLIAEFFDIIDFASIFLEDLEIIENNINFLYGKTKLLKKIVTGSKEERAEKKKIIQKIFPNFKIKKFAPSQKAIVSAKESLPTFLKAHAPYEIIATLKNDS